MSLKRLGSTFVPIGAYTPIGQMHSRITLMNPPARSADGGYDSPTSFAESWAKVASLQGRELYKAQEIVQEVTHMVTIPYMPGVQEKMTILLENRTLVIEAVQDPDERKVELRLMCVERNQNA